MKAVGSDGWSDPEWAERLTVGAAELGIRLTPREVELFQRYGRELAVWNRRINLSAISDAEGVLRKHFLDSLAILPYLPEQAENLADVGSGAGFPGVPLKIARAELEVVLLESVGKKTEFLRHVVRALELSGVTVRQERAEAAGRDPALREAFAVVTGRAVAPLPVLAELALPLVRVGGVFLAPKGPAVQDELKAATRALAVLGGEVESVKEFELPYEAGRRSLVLVRKVAPTPAAYPRPAGRPAKRPL